MRIEEDLHRARYQAEQFGRAILETKEASLRLVACHFGYLEDIQKFEAERDAAISAIEDQFDDLI